MPSAQATEVFIGVLRSALTDTPMEHPERINQYGKDICILAKAQDVLQLICHGIKNNNMAIPDEFNNSIIREVYRYTQNEYALEKAKQALFASGISFIPLKGAIIKDLYPEKWMRSSCDIDILVKEADLENAIHVLKTDGFRTDSKKEYHDISLYYGSAHLELHYNICENIQRIDRELIHVWQNTVKVSEFEYRETPAFFAFHLIAHLLYHFLRGGCNIKQFVDLWLLRRNHYYEENDIRRYLSRCRLEKFYDVICDAIDSWFDGKESSALTESIAKQVFRGGLHGNEISSDTVSTMLNGGKIKHLLRTAFIPAREMRLYYPVLEKRPLLLPLYYCIRLYTKVFGAERNRAQNLLKVNLKNNSDEQSDIMKMLNEMGLD